jgi:hypothetical protein
VTGDRNSNEDYLVDPDALAATIGDLLARKPAPGIPADQ